MHYQNLAYCRYLFVWSFLFLLNVVHYSPAGSLSIVIFINYFLNQSKNTMTKNKFYGMVISEIALFSACLLKVFDFYWKENLIFFVSYCGTLYIIGIDPIYLHSTLLSEDDNLHKDELYFPYMTRVWGLFLYSPVPCLGFVFEPFAN